MRYRPRGKCRRINIWYAPRYPTSHVVAFPPEWRGGSRKNPAHHALGSQRTTQKSGTRIKTTMGNVRGFGFPFSTDATSHPNAWLCPYDHDGNTQPPCPPQYHFSLYIAWLMKRYSEDRIPDTRKIQFLASLIGPPRDLHQRLLWTEMWWHRRANGRLGTTDGLKGRPDVTIEQRRRSCYWVRMHSCLNSSTSAQNSRFDIRPKWCRRDWNGSISRKNPLGVSIQLLIFHFCYPTRGIDALLRRFGSQEAASFVGSPWIFHICLGIRIAAKIRWGAIDVEIEPRGAESRLILPRYVSKNGTACVSDILIMWNPLHSHLLRRKIKSSSFFCTSPFRYHFRCRCTKLPPTIDHRPSNRIVYTYCEHL